MKVNSTQKSISYPHYINPDMKKTTNFNKGFYSGTFLKDVKLFISNDNCEIKLANKDSELEERIINAFENVLEYKRNDLDSALKYFIKSCAVDLLYFNESNYEIVFENNEFNFVKIPFNTLKIENGKKYQVIHDEIVNERNLPNKKIKLGDDNIISFKGPKKYNLQETMKNLSIIDNLHNRNLLSLINQNKPNIKDLSYLEKVAVGNITKDIGWNFRIEYSMEEVCLDYYYYHRFLLFQKFLAIFRENIIEEINIALNYIGMKIGFSNKIIMDGTTLDFVEDIIKKYKEGKIGYDKLSTIFF